MRSANAWAISLVWREAQMPADAGQMPTPEEEAAAEQNDVDPAVARAEKEATERGANQKGEGRLP